MFPLRSLVLVTALFAAPASLVWSADAGHGMNHSSMHGQASAVLVDGIVKKVDKAAGKLTVAHGPLPNGMPAMTMAYKVKNPAWLEQVKESQGIRFAQEEINGAMTIVQLEVAR